MWPGRPAGSDGWQRQMMRELGKSVREARHRDDDDDDDDDDEKFKEENSWYAKKRQGPMGKPNSPS